MAPNKVDEGLSSRSSTSFLTSALAALPVELAYHILDECLMGASWLTHKGLCALRSLALTSRSAKSLVTTYLNCEIPSAYLREQLNVQWWPYMPAVIHLTLAEMSDMAPIEGLPGQIRDIVTDTVIDDCPECFDWLCKKIPNLEAGACNKHGWSFVAIAYHAGSFRILEHFLNPDYPLKAAIALLSNPANHNTLRPTLIGLMAQKKDLRFFERFFDIIEPHLHALRLPSVIRGSLTDEDKLHICTFATPELAERLEEVGVILYDITIPRSSSWHAGALNGPAFLDYLNRNSVQISKDGPMWVEDTPLYTAVEANRLDSVRWLRRHGASPKLTYTGNSRRNPIHLAVTLDSETSIDILEELLPAPRKGGIISSLESGKLLFSLVEGLVGLAHGQAVRSDLDNNAYQEFLDLHEDRAVRKCRLILRVSAGDHLKTIADSSGPRMLESGRHLAIRQHEKARKLACLAGFERLVNMMDHTDVYVCSPISASVVFQIC